MKRVLLALDIQENLKTPEMIITSVNRLAEKVPTLATVLTKDPEHPKESPEWLNWKAPNNDHSRVNTKYSYARYNYTLPPVILKTIKHNNIDEVLVCGAHTEAFLLGAGMQLFDLGIKVSMVAPLVLTGQYHQHTVTLKIWEQSIGTVYETVAELDLGVN